MSAASRRRRPVFDADALDVDSTLAPPEPPAPESDHANADEGGPEEQQETPGLSSDERRDTAGTAAVGVTATSSTAGRDTSSSRARSASATRSRPQPPATRQGRSTRGRIATAVRLPAEVYRDVNDVLLSGAERPSYGQLVMWTLEDHRAEVGAQVERDLPDPSTRTPRGRRLAEDRVPIGLQLLADERADLDDLAADVSDRNEGAKVTRTDVAVAALRVALRARQSSVR